MCDICQRTIKNKKKAEDESSYYKTVDIDVTPAFDSDAPVEGALHG